jgi:hypothetical protein
MYVISEEDKNYYKYLDEKHKRLYAGLLSTRIGRGGIKAVSEAFCINRNTVSSGKKELHNLPPVSDKKIRRQGGGAKKN